MGDDTSEEKDKQKDIKVKIKPDIALKKYWSNKERFADLFNAVFFDGAQEILPELLTEGSTEVSNIITGSNNTESIERNRDVVMEFSGIYLAVMCIENEDKVHYAMPVRTLLYDGLSYQRQCDEYKKIHNIKNDLTHKEFLSHMAKDDKLRPVITIVVYCGKEEWDGATSLKDMLDLSDVPERLWALINDYKINLVDMSKTNLKFNNVSNKSFSEGMKVWASDLSYKEKKERYNVIWEHSRDYETLRTFASVTKLKSVFDYVIEKEEIGGEVDMKEAIEEAIEAAIAEGEAIGKTRGEAIGEARGRARGEAIGEARGIIKMAIEFNGTKDFIIKKLVAELNITLQEAENYYKEFSQK